MKNQCKDCGGASICEHNLHDYRGTTARTTGRLYLRPPPSEEQVHRLQAMQSRAYAPHDTSRTSARGSCGRRRRSPLRPRSTHKLAMPSDATGGWPCLHPPSVFSRAHHIAHTTAHTGTCSDEHVLVCIRNVAYAHSTSLIYPSGQKTAL